MRCEKAYPRAQYSHRCFNLVMVEVAETLDGADTHFCIFADDLPSCVQSAH